MLSHVGSTQSSDRQLAPIFHIEVHNLWRCEEKTNIGDKGMDYEVKLLEEVDSVCRYMFHQSVDEITKDLQRKTSLPVLKVTPEEKLRMLYRSGILFQNSDKVLVRAREAVARFVHGEYLICTRCGEGIPPARLAVTPTANLCMKCSEE